MKKLEINISPLGGYNIAIAILAISYIVKLGILKYLKYALKV